MKKREMEKERERERERDLKGRTRKMCRSSKADD